MMMHIDNTRVLMIKQLNELVDKHIKDGDGAMADRANKQLQNLCVSSVLSEIERVEKAFARDYEQEQKDTARTLGEE